MFVKENKADTIIGWLTKPRMFGLGIVHIAFWSVLTLVVLDIGRLTQEAVTTEPYVFRPLDLKTGLGKPSGGNMLELRDDGQVITDVNMEQLRGQWTVVVFTLLSDSDVLITRGSNMNLAGREKAHQETLSSSLMYLARHLQSRGARILFVQLDDNRSNFFNANGSRRIGSHVLSYVHLRPDYPWDKRLIAATKNQKHKRYYTDSYYPTRVWLEREWVRRYYAKERGWMEEFSPTREFIPMPSVPFYAILDPTGELRWMGFSDVQAEVIVATLYKHMNVDKLAAPRAVHVLSPLYPVEQHALGRLRVNLRTTQQEDVRRRFLGEACAFCPGALIGTSAYLLLGVGPDGMPARDAMDWQERIPLKVEVRGNPILFPGYTARKHILHKFYPDEARYPW